jgi:hypothetical protein
MKEEMINDPLVIAGVEAAQEIVKEEMINDPLVIAGVEAAQEIMKEMINDTRKSNVLIRTGEK